MGEEQWCLAVPRREAEERRRRLLEEGLLDRRFRPRPEGDAILFPVTEEVPGTVRCEFEAVSERLDLPPVTSSWEGSPSCRRTTRSAERLLASRPSLATVLFPETAVEGGSTAPAGSPSLQECPPPAPG